MKWTELINRCALFVDAPRVTLKKLLEEAEKEMAVECDIFEDTFEYTCSTGTSSNYVQLPLNFKNVISLYVNGHRINAIDEADLDLQKDNTFDEGTPSNYYIKNDYLYFDTKPDQDDNILMNYNATLEHAGVKELHIPILKHIEYGELQFKNFYKDKEHTTYNTIGVIGAFYVESNNDYDVYGKVGQVRWPNRKEVSSIGQVYYFEDASSTVTRTEEHSPKATPVKEFWHTQTFSTTHDVRGCTLVLENHTDSPSVPEQYHRSLCDYAIALASAKSSPEMYGRHMELWGQNLINIKEQASDRELIFNIREII